MISSFFKLTTFLVCLLTPSSNAFAARTYPKVVNIGNIDTIRDIYTDEILQSKFLSEESKGALEILALEINYSRYFTRAIETDLKSNSSASYILCSQIEVAIGVGFSYANCAVTTFYRNNTGVVFPATLIGASVGLDTIITFDVGGVTNISRLHGNVNPFSITGAYLGARSAFAVGPYSMEVRWFEGKDLPSSLATGSVYMSPLNPNHKFGLGYSLLSATKTHISTPRNGQFVRFSWSKN